MTARKEFLLINKFRSDNKGRRGGTVVSTGFLCGVLSPLVPQSKGSPKVS